MRVAYWSGIVIKIFNDDHPRPHVHVWYSGDKARIYIRNQELFDGNIPLKIYRRVRKWLERCQEKILYRWEIARAADRMVPPLTEDCEDDVKTED